MWSYRCVLNDCWNNLYSDRLPVYEWVLTSFKKRSLKSMEPTTCLVHKSAGSNGSIDLRTLIRLSMIYVGSLSTVQESVTLINT